MDARHRAIGAIAEKIAAGELPEDVAREFGRPVEAAHAACAWALEHPDAAP